MPRIFSIEGNIGAGKTTLLAEIERLSNSEIHVIREPVDIWMSVTDENGEGILQKFYKDPKKYAFAFQVLAFNTRLDLLKNAIREHPECATFICERSLHADSNIFAKMLFDDGMIDDISYKIYQKIYESGISEFPLDGVIYLNVPPETCAERIVKRNRTGEDKISLEYLNSCHTYHENWLKRTDLEYSVVEYTNLNDLIQHLG
jgi:deoxycitidine kinase/deoxyguanosine kinase